MNKELQFKAKNKKTGEWIYFTLEYLWNCCKRWLDIDWSTVCSFTGLLAENKDKIYESDLVEYECNNCEETHIGKIIWHPLACWGILTHEGKIFPLQIPINPKDLEDGLDILPIKRVVNDTYEIYSAKT